MTMTFNADVSGTFGTIEINGVPQIEVHNDGSIKNPSGDVIASGAGIVGDASLGAVMESGNNANGYYIKFQDGTMICSNLDSQGFTVSNVNGALYSSPGVSVTYPATFISVQSCECNTPIQVGAQSWADVTTVGLSAATLIAFSGVNGVTGQFAWSVIGRWK